MTDITQLREAVANGRRYVHPGNGIWMPLLTAAEKYLAIREAGALIITPDEDLKKRLRMVLLGNSHISTTNLHSVTDKILLALRDSMPPEDAK